MSEVKIWDVFVRVFHWSLIICFSLNALLLDDESKWHQWVGYMVAGLVGFAHSVGLFRYETCPFFRFSAQSERHGDGL